jgi:hypothetical protein
MASYSGTVSEVWTQDSVYGPASGVDLAWLNTAAPVEWATNQAAVPADLQGLSFSDVVALGNYDVQFQHQLTISGLQSAAQGSNAFLQVYWGSAAGGQPVLGDSVYPAAPVCASGASRASGYLYYYLKSFENLFHNAGSYPGMVDIRAAVPDASTGLARDATAPEAINQVILTVTASVTATPRGPPAPLQAPVSPALIIPLSLQGPRQQFQPAPHSQLYPAAQPQSYSASHLYPAVQPQSQPYPTSQLYPQAPSFSQLQLDPLVGGLPRGYHFQR